MTRSMQNSVRRRSAVLRLLAAATGALATIALVRWTLTGDARHDSAILGLNAALSAILIAWIVWKFTRKGEDCAAADSALRESEEQLRLFAEGVLEYAIIGLDLDGRVTSWNAGAQRIEGYAPDQIIGRSISEFYIPEDIAAGKPAMVLKMAAELGQWQDEGWRVRANGTLFWASVLITALKDDAGNLRGFSNLTRDVTVRELAREDGALIPAAGPPAILSSTHFSSIVSQG